MKCCILTIDMPKPTRCGDCRLMKGQDFYPWCSVTEKQVGEDDISHWCPLVEVDDAT